MHPSQQILTTERAREIDAALWQFMLAVYARPGVAAACLDIQERCGTDIVMLLAWLYHECRAQEPLGAAEISALTKLVEEWRSRTVLPLRHLRVELRATGETMPDEARETLREKVKALELSTERVQVSMMAAWLADHQCRDTTDLRSALVLIIGSPDTVALPLALLRRNAALA